jgi:hypothetical protein
MCPGMDLKQDTMKMPIGGDIKSLLGRWKSTTQISNDAGEPVTLYFDIYPGSTGKLTAVELDQSQFFAGLSVSISPSLLQINQNEYAVNPQERLRYYPYEYSCSSGANGNADCLAQNKFIKANRFTFNLVKIQ